MILEEPLSINNFWTVGINYKKADATLRGNYAVSHEQYLSILEKSAIFGLNDFFVLSTCNRTEIYGQCSDPNQLMDLLCSETKGDIATFRNQCYIKNSHDAILHLYEVAAGLDSQILGDYEIVGQLKNSFKIAKQNNKTSLFTERLYKSVLQSSRDIRSKTDLSSGSVSVSFAAIQYLLHTSKNMQNEQILIIGSGKMGIASCKNLIQLSYADNIAITNRTDEHAKTIADELNIHFRPFSKLNESIKHATAIIVATNAPKPILNKSHFDKNDKKILIDLSIPNNIDTALKHFGDLHLVNVDELSKVNDETLKLRMQDIPKAKTIINFNIHQFADWYIMQKNVPMIKEVKKKLSELNNELGQICELDKDNVQKALNQMASKIRHGNTKPGCTYIETISNYVAEHTQP